MTRKKLTTEKDNMSLIMSMGILAACLILLLTGIASATTEAPVISQLEAANTASEDDFGRSVALFGDTVVIGSPGAHVNNFKAGRADVFIRSGNSWQKQASLVADTGAAGDLFGASVSISGDTIVIGAAGVDDNGIDSGAVYVFVRSGTTWQLQQKLTADDAAAGDQFGFDVAIDGDTIVIGSPFDDDKGSAYTFLRSLGGWEQQSKILAYGARIAGDHFGRSVAIGYDTIIIGADGDDNIATDDGSAFIYSPYGSGWRYWAKLVGSEAAEGDRFGFSVAVGLYKALVGINPIQRDEAIHPGAAYAFNYTSYRWTEVQRIESGNHDTDDGFGHEVALYDNHYLVGAPGATVDSLSSGAVYVYTPSETSPWLLHARLTPPEAADGDQFGSGAAIYGDTVIGGLPGHNGGSAYAYMFPCGLGRYLPPSEWEMISRPCLNNSPATTLLGDDIEGGIFAKTWILYRSDPANEDYFHRYGYFQLEATDPLNEGEGYWIYSVKGSTLEVNGAPTPTIVSGACPSVNGCVEIPLTFPPVGQRFWNNMVGNPFPYAIDWSDVLVMVTAADGSGSSVFTPTEAYEQKFLRSSFYRYENTRYNAYNDVTPGMNGMIMPFESTWVHTLDPAGHSFAASGIKLLIPAAGPSKTTTQ